MKALKDRVAVVGVGHTAFGNFPDRTDYGLAAEAFRHALADSGLARDDIDGLVCTRIPYYARMGAVLGIDPRWTLQMPAHGRMSAMAIAEAMMALHCGAATHVALLYANVGRSRRVNYGGEGYSGPAAPQERWHQHFGLIVASCEKADLRTNPKGVHVYGDTERRFEELPRPRVYRDEVVFPLELRAADPAKPVVGLGLAPGARRPGKR